MLHVVVFMGLERGCTRFSVVSPPLLEEPDLTARLNARCPEYWQDDCLVDEWRPAVRLGPLKPVELRAVQECWARRAHEHPLRLAQRITSALRRLGSVARAQWVLRTPNRRPKPVPEQPGSVASILRAHRASASAPRS